MPAAAQTEFNQSTGLNMCAFCLKNCEIPCTKQCEKIRDRRGNEKCRQQCAVRRCGTTCGYMGVDGRGQRQPRYSDEKISCDLCVNTAEGSKECTGGCSDSFNIPECRTRCARLQCAKQCNFPDVPIAPPDRQVQPHQCELCKRGKRRECLAHCGNDKQEAGTTACQVACIQQRCADKCRAPDAE